MAANSCRTVLVRARVACLQVGYRFQPLRRSMFERNLSGILWLKILYIKAGSVFFFFFNESHTGDGSRRNFSNFIYLFFFSWIKYFFRVPASYRGKSRERDCLSAK